MKYKTDEYNQARSMGGQPRVILDSTWGEAAPPYLVLEGVYDANDGQAAPSGALLLRRPTAKRAGRHSAGAATPTRFSLT